MTNPLGSRRGLPIVKSTVDKVCVSISGHFAALDIAFEADYFADEVIPLLDQDKLMLGFRNSLGHVVYLSKDNLQGGQIFWSLAGSSSISVYAFDLLAIVELDGLDAEALASKNWVLASIRIGDYIELSYD